MVRTVGTVVAGVTSKPLNAFIEMGYDTAVQNTKPGQVPKIYPDDHSTQSRGKKVWLDYSVKYKKITIMYWDQHSARPSSHTKFSVAQTKPSTTVPYLHLVYQEVPRQQNDTVSARYLHTWNGSCIRHPYADAWFALYGLSTLDDLMWKA